MQGQLTEHGRQWEPSIVQTRTTSPVSPKPHLFSTRSIAAAPSLLCVSLRPLPLWLPSPLLALSADMGGRRKRPSLRASSPALPPRASAVGAGRRKHAAPSRCSAGQCAQRPAAAATGRPRGEGNKERIRGERRARWGSFFLSLLSLSVSLTVSLSSFVPLAGVGQCCRIARASPYTLCRTAPLCPRRPGRFLSSSLASFYAQSPPWPSSPPLSDSAGASCATSNTHLRCSISAGSQQLQLTLPSCDRCDRGPGRNSSPLLDPPTPTPQTRLSQQRQALVQRPAGNGMRMLQLAVLEKRPRKERQLRLQLLQLRLRLKPSVRGPSIRQSSRPPWRSCTRSATSPRASTLSTTRWRADPGRRFLLGPPLGAGAHPVPPPPHLCRLSAPRQRLATKSACGSRPTQSPTRTPVTRATWSRSALRTLARCACPFTTACLCCRSTCCCEAPPSPLLCVALAVSPHAFASLLPDSVQDDQF